MFAPCKRAWRRPEHRTHPLSATRLDLFRQKIAAESANLDVARALEGVSALPARQHPAIATMAVIASADLTRDLASAVSVVTLRRADWRRQIEQSGIDLVVVESDYTCLDGWRGDLLSDGADNQLLALARACRAKGLSCALWVTLQLEQVGLLAHLLDAFTHVFVADPQAG